MKVTASAKKKVADDELDNLMDTDLLADDEEVKPAPKKPKRSASPPKGKKTSPERRRSPPRNGKAKTDGDIAKIPVKMEVDEETPVNGSKMEIAEENLDEDELAALEAVAAVERSISEEDQKKRKAALAPVDISMMTDESIVIEDEEDKHEYTGSDWFKIESQVNRAGVTQARKNKQGFVNADFKPLLDGNGRLLVYWFDAYEDAYHRPGTVFLFGHVWDPRDGSFHSICVTIENLQRVLHFFPKPGCTPDDVRAEFNELRRTIGVKNFLSKPVEKNYVFEVSTVSRGKHAFLEVIYPFSDDPLPPKIEGKTFAHVFGTSRTALETLILDAKLMGPGWVVMKDPIYHSAPSTWCEYECKLGDSENLMVAKFPSSGPSTATEEAPSSNTTFQLPPTPKLRILSLKVQVLHDHESKTNEILAISGIERANFDVENATEIDELYAHSFNRFSILRKVYGLTQPVGMLDMLKNNPAITFENTEKALLNHLMARIGDFDPDVIVGHGLASFDLDVLLHRLNVLKVATWSKLGRLHKSQMPRLKALGEGDATFAERQATAGRLICDTYTAANEFLRSQKNYKLSTLAKVHLNAKRIELPQNQIVEMLTKTDDIKTLCASMVNDAYLALQLVAKLDVLPLTRQLTQLGGNLWSRSLTGARAERIEYLLMHKFYDLPRPNDADKTSYILPDKVKLEASEGGGKSKNKPAYKGGLVLAPKAGLYQQATLLLDFNSLYPSLIQEYNVCFTTIERSQGANGEWLPSDPPPPSAARGVLPSAIRELVDKRKEVKQRLKTENDPTKRKQLEMRQLAIKLVANSMYGCLGFKNSRFHAMPLAELITRKGREALTKAQEIAGKLNMEVIYGDTDSIMINTHTTDYKEVKAMGFDLQKQINKTFNQLEIGIDGIFRSLLLLQKKKYAAMVCEERPDGTVVAARQEKGLDLVRRDWCNLAGNVGRAILDCIFDEHRAEGTDVAEGIQEILRTQGNLVREGKIPIEDFAITKSLSKKPEEYPDAHSQPHVQVALAMRREGQNVVVGEAIPYVICVLGGGQKTANDSISDRARHPQAVRRDNLKIDYDWYLIHQVHASACRLVEHIHGLDSAVVAECLGLDANHFKRAQTSSGSDLHMPAASQQSRETRFSQCERWRLTCDHCGTQYVFGGLSTPKKNEHDLVSTFFEACRCPTQTCPAPDDVFLVNHLMLFLRRLQGAAYAAEYACNECGRRTKEPFYLRGRSICASCFEPVTSEAKPKELYTQLLYLKSVFDVEDAMKYLELDDMEKKQIRADPRVLVLQDLLKHVTAAIDQNKYASMSCEAIFSCFAAGAAMAATTVSYEPEEEE